ncbi:hypothetical protein BWI17_13010 [Betaproteobacteria bacterium GR16-43]|nr:hypothetical protein BWI17_13010 [Betaproteobacteria bacterium GR16-43]
MLPIAALVVAVNALSAQPADIVLTPPPGAGVSVTNAAGNVTQFRVAEDGSVTIPGTILKGGLSFIHNFGSANAFFGASAGNFTMTGGNNTGLGAATLLSNTTGQRNTAVGALALVANATGNGNTGLGYNALFQNTGGANNTATGANALNANSTGVSNVATGSNALINNTSASENTALGFNALYTATSGSFNTAAGAFALVFANGSSNTALGDSALQNVTSGDANIGIGYNAGSNVTTGDHNIAIGGFGAADESNTIRIGTAAHQTRIFVAAIRGVTTGLANAVPVVIDNNGQLGTVNSSERFKDDIADMGEASDALMQLRPVTFHYKQDQDPAGRTLQYGLIAEEVAQVYPGLIAHSADGQVETVMTQFLPAMLLNEVQKQRRTIERLENALAAMQRRLGISQEETK